MFDNEWIPTQKGFNDELDRIRSTIGRYPIGFRHYETYHNYLTKYPEATLEDYQHDVN